MRYQRENDAADAWLQEHDPEYPAVMRANHADERARRRAGAIQLPPDARTRDKRLWRSLGDGGYERRATPYERPNQ